MDYLSIAIAVPAVVAIVEVFKRAGIPDRFAPLFSLFFGIAYVTAYTVLAGRGETVNSVYLGLFVGLSASGLYSFANKTVYQPIAGMLKKPSA